jgi:hypothetical protein
VYKVSVNVLFIYSYEIVQFYAYVVRSDINYLMLLLLLTRVRNDKLATPWQLPIGSRQTSSYMNPTLSVLSSVRPDMLGRCSKQTVLSPFEREEEGRGRSASLLSQSACTERPIPSSPKRGSRCLAAIRDREVGNGISLL